LASQTTHAIAILRLKHLDSFFENLRLFFCLQSSKKMGFRLPSIRWASFIASQATSKFVDVLKLLQISRIFLNINMYEYGRTI